MKKLLMIILILFSIVLTSCMGTNGLEQYVGEYVIEADYNRTYHYYFGSTKKVNEANLIGRSFTFEIKDDATIEVTYDNGDKDTGKVSCTPEKIKFRNVDCLSGYEFKFSKKDSDIYLTYTKTENKFGFEYDYKSEGVIFKKKMYIN